MRRFFSQFMLMSLLLCSIGSLQSAEREQNSWQRRWEQAVDFFERVGEGLLEIRHHKKKIAISVAVLASAGLVFKVRGHITDITERLPIMRDRVLPLVAAIRDMLKRKNGEQTGRI